MLDLQNDLSSIRNGGADVLRLEVVVLATALAVAAASALAAGILLAGGPAGPWALATVIPVLAALLLSGLLARSLHEYLAAPAAVEHSAIIVMFRYRGGRFLGLSWAEIKSVIPGRTRFGILGGPLYDLKLAFTLKKGARVRNLSLAAARSFVEDYQRHARKRSPEEARQVSDGLFDIKKF